MTIMMKLVLVVSFVALSAALPSQEDNSVGKGSEQGDPGNVIFGGLRYMQQAIEYVYQGLVTVDQRVLSLEGQVEEIKKHLSGEGGQENIPDGSGYPEEPPTGPEPERSDETAIRMLMQKLKSRLQEKKREQKQFK